MESCHPVQVHVTTEILWEMNSSFIFLAHDLFGRESPLLSRTAVIFYWSLLRNSFFDNVSYRCEQHLGAGWEFNVKLKDASAGWIHVQTRVLLSLPSWYFETESHEQEVAHKTVSTHPQQIWIFIEVIITYFTLNRAVIYKITTMLY